MTVRSPQSREDFRRYYDLRWRILRRPWGEPEGSEKDGMEDESFHVMARERDKRPVGVGRLHFSTADEAHIRYMAVEEDFRGRGVGRLVLAELEEIAEREGARRIALDAREAALGFYERMGYKTLGPSHTLFGSIRHWRMMKTLGAEEEG